MLGREGSWVGVEISYGDSGPTIPTQEYLRVATPLSHTGADSVWQLALPDMKEEEEEVEWEVQAETKWI